MSADVQLITVQAKRMFVSVIGPPHDLVQNVLPHEQHASNVGPSRMLCARRSCALPCQAQPSVAFRSVFM